MHRMSSLAHAECPSCGWSVLLTPIELAALGGCRQCGGPLTSRASPIPWHGHAPAHPKVR